MRSGSTWVMVLLLSAGVLTAQEKPAREPAAAAPFWEARPFEQWTLAETLTLLTDSPWSRPATLVEPGVEVHLGKMRYYAQWQSAQTMREARVRFERFKGPLDPEAEKEFLEAPQRAYQLYVFAGFRTETGGLQVVPLDAFEEITAEELKQGIGLIFSFQGYSSAPDSVEFLHDSETRQLVGLRLRFERARTAVPPEEAGRGQVRIVCPTRRGSLSATFEPSQMQRRGQPDL